MKVLALVLALFVSPVFAGTQAFQDVGRHDFCKPSTMPDFIARHLTFKADLMQSLQATGAGNTNATFTRASIATYTHPVTGLITLAASGEPRFEANGYLSEGERTNLLIWSSAYYLGGWSETNLNAGPFTIGAVAPDGTSSTLYIMQENTANSRHVMQQAFTQTTGKSVSISIYAKSGGRTILGVRYLDAGTGSLMRCFDLSSGSKLSLVSTGSASDFWESSSSITPAPNGWYRCVMVTGTSTGTARFVRFATIAVDGIQNYSGDNSSSLFIWGAQIEDNATFASSYIPTTTGAVARAADLLIYSGVGNIIDNGTGTVTAQGVFSQVTEEAALIALCKGTSLTNASYLYASTGSAGFLVYANSGIQCNINAGTVVAGTKYRFSGAWEANKFVLQGGDGIGTDTAGTVPAGMNSIVSGKRYGTTSGNSQYGNLSSVILFFVPFTAWEIAQIK